MIDKIKILIDAAVDDKLIETLIEICKIEATEYCNLAEYSTNLDAAVIQMVIERYNKLGVEGLNSQSPSTISSSFVDGYSKQVYQMLQKHRKIRVV